MFTEPPLFAFIRRLLKQYWRFPKQRSRFFRRVVERIRDSLELKVVLQNAVNEVTVLLELEQCVFLWCFTEQQRIQVVCEAKPAADRATRLGDHALSAWGHLAASLAKGELVVEEQWVDANLLQAIAGCWRPLLGWPSPVAISPPSIFEQVNHLYIPVYARDSAVGYLVCLAGPQRRWSMWEIEFLQTIAQQLEIAIRQARLYEQTQRQARREQLVNQITLQTRQSFDLEVILTQAIAHLLEAIEADRCLVHLVESYPQSAQSSLLASQPEPAGDNPDLFEFRRRHLYETCRPPFPATIADFDLNGPITQWVVQNLQPVVIPDITQDPRIGPHNQEYQRAAIKSSLALPVQANGRLYAILYLNQCSHLRYWSASDQQLAQAVADQLAISIRQAHLYARTEQQAIASAAQAQRLAHLLKELRMAQTQLIQSEKLSSLGQMVAGLAHEINNPIGFIYGNIACARNYLADLLQLLRAYQRTYPEATPEIQALSREIDLEFLLQDFSEVFNSMSSGAERIRHIILALRNFSRLDESHYKSVDVHEGLENTLLLLQGSLNQIEVVRSYGPLPPIDCYPRLLNQVFMSLLSNAVEALQMHHRTPKAITLTTEVFTDPSTTAVWIRIRIADNGPGIPLEIQPKIFDPFFTTKEIGKGSGLGLAVSYQTIVNQHQGKLLCHSQPGQGSEFVIELPVHNPQLGSKNPQQMNLLTYPPSPSLDYSSAIPPHPPTPSPTRGEGEPVKVPLPTWERDLGCRPKTSRRVGLQLVGERMERFR